MSNFIYHLQGYGPMSLDGVKVDYTPDGENVKLTFSDGETLIVKAEDVKEIQEEN